MQQEVQAKGQEARSQPFTDPHVQSKSFKLLQMMTEEAGEKEIDEEESESRKLKIIVQYELLFQFSANR